MIPAVAVEDAQLLSPGDGLTGMEVDESEVVREGQVGGRLGEQSNEGHQEGQGDEAIGQPGEDPLGDQPAGTDGGGRLARERHLTRGRPSPTFAATMARS